MNRTNLAGLVVLNVVLLAMLAFLSITPENAEAQARRARGDYLMVTGEYTGLQSEVVYIYDMANQEMLVLTYDGKKIIPLVSSSRNVKTDFEKGAGGR